jgi:hypothetical protein
MLAIVGNIPAITKPMAVPLGLNLLCVERLKSPVQLGAARLCY